MKKIIYFLFQIGPFMLMPARIEHWMENEGDAKSKENRIVIFDGKIYTRTHTHTYTNIDIE